MKIFRKITALTVGALLASSLLLFGACTTTPADPVDPEKPTEPDDTSVYALTTSTTQCMLLVGDENYGTAQATFVAKKDKVVDENPEIKFTTGNPAVATVDASGVVTPRMFGKTELIAKYHNKTVRVPIIVYERTTAENVNSFSEDYVNRYGRQYFTDGKLNVDNVASGIEVGFLGDSLTVDVSVIQDVYVHVYIDGDTEGEFKQLTPGTFTLAKDLGEGIHTVRMFKASEGDRGKFTINSFEAEEFLRIPEKSDLKVEFIGDSITAGYGNLVEGGTWSVDNSDGCASYAALTGMQLDADFSVVALSGICLTKDVWGANINMTQLHTYFSWRYRQPYTYDADMDVVVLALGTNDASYINQNHVSYGKQFPTDYAEYLKHLRDIYPDAYIVCIYGMMGKNATIDNGIKKALEEVNDAKISYKTFPANTFGANSHPSGAAHVTYAKQLTEYIQELISA